MCCLDTHSVDKLISFPTSLLLLFQAGTVIYIAPEVLRNKYTLSADLWSVGIIAYLLLTGRLPFAGEEGEEVSDLFIRKQTFQNRVRLCTTRRKICLGVSCMHSVEAVTSDMQ